MSKYSKEDINGKAEWEGGLDEALSWFKQNDVPEEIQVDWGIALMLKEVFEVQLAKIQLYLDSE